MAVRVAKTEVEEWQEQEAENATASVLGAPNNLLSFLNVMFRFHHWLRRVEATRLVVRLS